MTLELFLGGGKFLERGKSLYVKREGARPHDTRTSSLFGIHSGCATTTYRLTQERRLEGELLSSSG